MQKNLSALSDRINGRVLLPDDDDYDSLRKSWLEVMEQRPGAIVEARSVDDVVAAIDFARAEGMQLAVTATGHGIAAPCNGGLLLNLLKMKTIEIDVVGKTVTVGPGVLADELLAKTQPHRLLYASGQVSSVGVIGYTLGGGMGWLVRKLGAASYAVVSVDVALADGSVVRASAATNADLFWAVRGGGGNFGVVVALEMGLAIVPEIVGGEIHYPFERAREVLLAYREWSSALSDEVSTVARLSAPPPGDDAPPALRGKKTCMIGVCRADEQSAGLLDGLLDRLGVPLLSDVKPRTLADMAMMDPASHLAGSPTYGQVEFLKALSDDVIGGIVNIAETMIPPLMQLEVQQLGGALTRENGDGGAFQPSSAPYLLHLVSPVTPKASMDDVAKATRDAYAALGDAYTGEANYNFLRWNETERIPRAFGEVKYRRLRELKRRFDPDNLFRLNLNVTPNEP